MLAATPAQAAKPKLDLSLKGTVAEITVVCGTQRTARVVDVGGAVAAKARVRVRRARSALLERSRCEAGSWVVESRRRLGRGSGRHAKRLDSSRPGDYKLRLLVKRKGRRAARGKPLYLKVRSVPGPTPPGIVDVPVSFAVQNLNRTAAPCASDGAAYEVRGRLVGPRAALEADAPAVTLYLHGLGYGEFFWRFQERPGYDYAIEQARAGRASVVIDRLGYDTSDHPAGSESCLGAQADVAHQVIEQLRSGVYSAQSVEPGTPPAPLPFAKVALAGHSIGGAIAQVEAYSFADVDALIVMSYADQGSSQTAQSEFLATGLVCATGGEPAEPDGPGGYAYFGQTDEDFQAAMFHDIEPEVAAAATAARNRDPCGDTGSVVGTIASDQLNLSSIEVPVLLASGENDALFPPAALEEQAANFSGSSDVKLELIPGTGHALTLERSASTLRSLVSSWLAARGF